NKPNASVPPAAARLSGPELGPTNRSASRNSAAASISRKPQALIVRGVPVAAMNFPARVALLGPPMRNSVPDVFSPARNRIQAASGQSLSGCEAPIPSTIQGRAQEAYCSPIADKTAAGSGKSGSVDGNGT